MLVKSSSSMRQVADATPAAFILFVMVDTWKAGGGENTTAQWGGEAPQRDKEGDHGLS